MAGTDQSANASVSDKVGFDDFNLEMKSWPSLRRGRFFDCFDGGKFVVCGQRRTEKNKLGVVLGLRRQNVRLSGTYIWKVR